MPARIECHFLDWDEPLLARSAQWLLNLASDTSGDVDLGDLLCVLPGSRARRGLIGTLVDLAHEQDRALVPPLALTPGEVPVALLGSPGQPAPAMIRRCAWIEALKGLDPEVLAPLLPHPLDADDLPGFSRLAAALDRVSKNLAGQGLRMSDVPRRAGDALPPEEQSRWHTLGLAQDLAERLLVEQGWVDEALAMIAKAMDPTTPTPAEKPRVILIGVAEMSRVERTAIVRGAGAVDVLAFAPESMRDRFDEMGCVDVEAWSSAPVELAEDRVVFADDLRDQAERALVCVAQRSKEVDVGEVVIGVADSGATSGLRRRAELAAGVTLRSGKGEPASRTPPGRLLSLLKEHLRKGTFDTMIALVRHPDVESALMQRSEPVADLNREKHEGKSEKSATTEWWLHRLDAIRRDHVLVEPTADPESVRDADREALNFVSATLHELLGDLARAPGTARPLGAWVVAMETALGSIYADRPLRPEGEADRRTIAGLKAVKTAMEGLVDASSRSDAAGEALVLPAALAWQVIALLEEHMEEAFEPEPPTPGAIETLGWLELALDPAPRCVVVGMTESNVPSSVTHDSLMPGSLCERLGLATNESRLARDAYLLTAINASRDAVFMTSRLGGQRDPQIPSRLLFRCAGATLAQRVRRFVRAESEQERTVQLASRLRAGSVDRFTPEVVIGPEYEPPTSMRVTDFYAYLRSPMGWYLERYLGLRDDDEAPRELSSRVYGTLAHATLELFGRDETARDLDDPKAVKAALSDLLDVAARRLLGDSPPAPVRIQTELLRHRLELFSYKQAERRRGGWRIERVEWSPDKEDAKAAIDVDGVPMRLRGKIDRIDVHDDGRWAVIDYKTGANAADVEKAHRKRKIEWTNLQLPLYRRLVESLGPPDQVQLGYGSLPAKKNDSAWSIAAWTQEDLESADEAARKVVRSIRDYKPGEAIRRGDHPPEHGALGFLTGARFDGDDDAAARELATERAS